jgi:serine/threonine protein kinase
MNKIINEEFEISEEVRGRVSSECLDLITRMLRKNPKERINMLEIANHPWILCSVEELYIYLYFFNNFFHFLTRLLRNRSVKILLEPKIEFFPSQSLAELPKSPLKSKQDFKGKKNLNYYSPEVRKKVSSPTRKGTFSEQQSKFPLLGRGKKLTYDFHSRSVSPQKLKPMMLPSKLKNKLK